MNQKLFFKYFQNRASEAEKEMLLKWVKASIENEEQFIFYKKMYALTPVSENIDHQNAWEHIRTRTIKPHKIKQNIKVILRIAAIFLISFFGLKAVEIYNKPVSEMTAFHSCIATDGQINEILLADGTKVWLNSGTKLKIPSDFSSNNRYVYMEGHGYFEVKHDPTSAFTVNTKQTEIKVLGTKFDLNTEHLDFLEVTLVKGKVQLLSKKKIICEMEPGEQIQYNYNPNSLNKKLLDNTDFYSSWKTGILKFDKVELSEILKILGKWHQVNYEYNDPEIGKICFSGTLLKKDSIEKSNYLFSSSSNLKFEITTLGTTKHIKIYRKE